MRKLLLLIALVVIAAIASLKALNVSEIKGMCEMAKENVDALADWIDISDCLDNCANTFHGDYCCIVRVGKTKITLYQKDPIWDF